MYVCRTLLYICCATKYRTYFVFEQHYMLYVQHGEENQISGHWQCGSRTTQQSTNICPVFIFEQRKR